MARYIKKRGSKNISRAIMNYIDENIDQELSLAKIADALFISVSTACHRFKGDYGISIKQYIINKKMMQAHDLIAKGYKAQWVCEMLGFENYSTFFRSYKKKFGISPSMEFNK